MNSLEAIENGLQAAILVDASASDLLAGAAQRSARGLDVYRAAYRARLTAALRDNFPVLLRALGDDAFAALASAYIDAHPSRQRSIRWFGDSLVDDLSRTSEPLPHPALVDLARMDWAMRAAFDAADAPCLTRHELIALAPEEWPNRRYRLVPSLQMVDLEWRVEPVWHALNNDPGVATEAPQRLAHTLLVWRRKLDCLWRSADNREGAALRALADGATFAECCSLLAEDGDAAAVHSVVAVLGQWLDEGLLARD